MQKVKTHWGEEEEPPEEIGLISIWGIALGFAILVLGTLFLLGLDNFIEKFGPVLIFVSVFLLSGALGSYIRRRSMNERKPNKS